MDSSWHRTRAFVVSSIVGSIVYLVLGWLIFDLVLGPFSESHTTNLAGFKRTTDVNIIALFLSCLAYSMVLSYWLQRAPARSVGDAGATSVIIGVLIACMTDFYWYASTTFYSDLSAVFVDVLGAALTVGILGAVNYLTLTLMSTSRST